MIPSINELMDLHDVSRDTARMVLKTLTNEGLVVSKTGKGTFVKNPVPLLKEWAVVVPFLSSNTENFIAKLKAEAALRGRGLHFYLDYNNPKEEQRLVSSLVNSGMEAIVLVPVFNEAETSDFYRRFRPGKTKIILADHTLAGSWFNYVIQSYDLGVKRALDHLVSKNKGNILLVKSDSWQGINLLDELIEKTLEGLLQNFHPERKLFLLKGVMNLDKKFLLENNIGGILAGTDSESIRIAGRLHKWGVQMPSSISLVSYGNTELLEFFSPGISAIDCRYSDIAFKLAELIEDPGLMGTTVQYVVQPILIERVT